MQCFLVSLWITLLLLLSSSAWAATEPVAGSDTAQAGAYTFKNGPDRPEPRSFFINIWNNNCTDRNSSIGTTLTHFDHTDCDFHEWDPYNEVTLDADHIELCFVFKDGKSHKFLVEYGFQFGIASSATEQFINVPIVLCDNSSDCEASDSSNNPDASFWNTPSGPGSATGMKMTMQGMDVVTLNTGSTDDCLAIMADRSTEAANHFLDNIWIRMREMPW